VPITFSGPDIRFQVHIKKDGALFNAIKNELRRSPGIRFDVEECSKMGLVLGGSRYQKVHTDQRFHKRVSKEKATLIRGQSRSVLMSCDPAQPCKLCLDTSSFATEEGWEEAKKKFVRSGGRARVMKHPTDASIACCRARALFLMEVCCMRVVRALVRQIHAMRERQRGATQTAWPDRFCPCSALRSAKRHLTM